MQAVGLLEDVQRSREQIVTAREEERRRIRRDLHDGVGPQLAGMALQLDSLMGRLSDDPVLSERARRLRDLMQSTVGDVRRVVDELRPPALDELGLVGALREQVNSYALERTSAVSGRPFVEVLVARELPLLPAAVEVAAYRIASEAVANVVRHAEATRCRLTLSVDDGWMSVEIRDDGFGIGPSSVPHVGLLSMSERAEELGGRLTITSTEAGTSVLASLPLRADR